MSTENRSYADLQSRLAIATERNRANAERRNELLAKIKADFGCNNLEELRKLLVETEEKLNVAEADMAVAKENAEKAVAEVEAALSTKG